MLAENQYVKIELTPKLAERYTSLGYVINENQKELKIKVEHLPISSSMVVDFICEECGQIYQKQRKNRKYRDICSKCRVDQAKKKFVGRDKVMKVFGKTKEECLRRVIRAESQGYECTFPIQQQEGMIDKQSSYVGFYYYTVMRLVEQ